MAARWGVGGRETQTRLQGKRERRLGVAEQVEGALGPGKTMKSKGQGPARGRQLV